MRACCVFAAVVCAAPGAVAPPGKSTIAAYDSQHALAFALKYLPATVAEDEGAGNVVAHGDEEIQGRVQLLLNGSYTERNCQLYTAEGATGSASMYYALTSNGLGKACTYSEGTQYTSGATLHKVFAYNKEQCCNACVATDGCASADFLTSSVDHEGGHGPQSWEGFGIHITDVTTAKTTGGISVAELGSRFSERLGDMKQFDAFMDYSVTLFTYDLQPYADAFKRDGVPFFVGQWAAGGDTWYSLFSRVNASNYVIELTSSQQPSSGAALPQLEQRMSDAHCAKFKSYGAHPAHLLWISSINRASSNVTEIDEVYAGMFKAALTHELSGNGVVRRCYNVADSSAGSHWCYKKNSASGQVPKQGTTACVPDGKGNCSFVQNADVQNSAGGSAVSVSSKDECCSKCAADTLCKAAAFVAATPSWDQDICFTQRTSRTSMDSAFSVRDFEDMLWAEHAATIGDNADSQVDKYTDNHYAQPINSVGLSALSSFFTANDPYPITKTTRLAYACKQNYIIDPTGWSIQPIGQASWPKCS